MTLFIYLGIEKRFAQVKGASKNIHQEIGEVFC